MNFNSLFFPAPSNHYSIMTHYGEMIYIPKVYEMQRDLLTGELKPKLLVDQIEESSPSRLASLPDDAHFHLTTSVEPSDDPKRNELIKLSEQSSQYNHKQKRLNSSRAELRNTFTSDVSGVQKIKHNKTKLLTRQTKEIQLQLKLNSYKQKRVPVLVGVV